MPDTAPPWLESMRADLGVEEIPGSAVNPRIITKARLPGVKFPSVAGLVAYGLLYKSDDEQAWCGAECGGCLAEVGIMPPFGPKDTDRYFWAASFRPWGVACEMRIGAIVCFDGHVTMVNRIIDASTIECIGGNQGSPKGGAVTRSVRKRADVRACRWPDDAALMAAGLSEFSLSAAPDAMEAVVAFRPEIKLGSTGGFVTELQSLLGVALDGEFGPDTDAAVRAFQAVHGLDVDGEVGPQTWAALSSSKPSASVGPAALAQETIARIGSLADTSTLSRISWANRGVAPRGYIKGMAVTFAKVYLDLKAGKSSSALAMTVPLGSPEKDALAWYGVPGLPRTDSAAVLRALFSLLIGLGMRESSGNYSEGRDTSASNTSADTAEAGLFQQSWNSHAASAEMSRLFSSYSTGNVDGFLSIFREGVAAKSTENFGSGDGAAFQALCKSKPAFAVECAAVGLRVLRQHWGPINRREAELRPEADALLQQVQAVVDAVKPPIDGEVLPPIKMEPGTEMHPDLVFNAAIMAFLERSNMTDLSMLFKVMQDPVIKKLMTGGAATIDELRALPAGLLSMLLGQSITAPPAIEPPKVDPSKADPVVEPAPAKVEPIVETKAPVIDKVGVAISAILAGLIGGDVVGTPFGTGAAPTTAGTLTAIAAIAAPFLNPSSMFAKIGGMVLQGLAGYAAKKTAK